MAYVQDNNGIFPDGGRVSEISDNGWVGRLGPYLPGKKLFQCPEDNGFEQDQAKASKHATDYYYNARLSGVKEKSVTSPFRTVLLGEGVGASGDYACLSPSSCTGTTDRGPVGTVPLSARQRHFEGGNYAFADGHTFWYKPDKISAELRADDSVGFAIK